MHFYRKYFPNKNRRIAWLYFKERCFLMSPLFVHGWILISTSAYNPQQNVISGFITAKGQCSHRYVN